MCKKTTSQAFNLNQSIAAAINFRIKCVVSTLSHTSMENFFLLQVYLKEVTAHHPLKVIEMNTILFYRFVYVLSIYGILKSDLSSVINRHAQHGDFITAQEWYYTSLDLNHKKYKISYTHKAKLLPYMEMSNLRQIRKFFCKGKKLMQYSLLAMLRREVMKRIWIRERGNLRVVGERSDDYGNISMFYMCENYTRENDQWKLIKIPFIK